MQTGLRGASRTRTYDPIDVNDVLYRLSHGTMSLDDMDYDTTTQRFCQPLKCKFTKKVRPFAEADLLYLAHRIKAVSP